MLYCVWRIPCYSSGAGFLNRRRLCQLTAAILTSDLTTRMFVLWSDSDYHVTIQRRVDPIRWTCAWRWRNGKFDCLKMMRLSSYGRYVGLPLLRRFIKPAPGYQQLVIFISRFHSDVFVFNILCTVSHLFMFECITLRLAGIHSAISSKLHSTSQPALSSPWTWHIRSTLVVQAGVRGSQEPLDNSFQTLESNLRQQLKNIYLLLSNTLAQLI